MGLSPDSLPVLVPVLVTCLVTYPCPNPCLGMLSRYPITFILGTCSGTKLPPPPPPALRWHTPFLHCDHGKHHFTTTLQLGFSSYCFYGL